MKAVKIVVLALSTLIASDAYATTLVGIWTEKQVTIAADCKQTLSDALGHIVGSQSACKIYEVRGIIFAFAGLAKAEQIDIVDSVRNAHELHEQGTGRDLPVESIVVASEAALVRVLSARGTLADPNAPISMIIAGKIDGKLKMIRFENSGIAIAGQFAYSPSSRRIDYPENRGYNGTDPNRGIEVIGFDNAIKAFQSNTPRWLKEKDVFLAEHLIALEAEDPDDSKFVGAPISEVVITKRGIKWVKKGTCQ